MSDPRPIYLDNHATTRCDPAVRDAMWPWFGERYGNAASRSHRFGVEARDAVERARSSLAAWIGGSPKELVFTSGATESDNLAILGGARLRRAEDGRRHVLTLATEHPAVLDPVRQLEREGFDVTVLGVGPDGLVDPAAFAAALRPDTALVSVMLVNNEIGVRQPIAALAAACRERGAWMHCDAAQGCAVPIDVAALGVDLLSLSAHKIHGPQGIGALYLRRGRPRVRLEPLVHGGGHERGLRSGTLPVALAVGFGVAADRVVEEHATGGPARLAALRDRMWARLSRELPGVRVNGSFTSRAPNNLHLSFDGVEAEALLMALRDVVALSTGSACSSETLAPSHVLRALGIPDEQAHASVRVGLSRFTTDEEIDAVVDALLVQVPRLRSLGNLYE